MKKDVIIIGAGAAGLMCAIEAGKRGRRVLVIDHAVKIANKIRISGGGRCNFTNINTGPNNYSSENPHFSKSALAGFTPRDFIAMLDRHHVGYHEEENGRMFCDKSPMDIVNMLRKECDEAGVEMLLNCKIIGLRKEDFFTITTSRGAFQSESLVIGTGGLSFPQAGATGFGHWAARKFGICVTRLGPALVSLIFNQHDMTKFRELSGVSFDALIGCRGKKFQGNILFTHRGVSGPAIFQISLYWTEGDSIVIDLLPATDILELLLSKHRSRMELHTFLSGYLPKRFIRKWCDLYVHSIPICQFSAKELNDIASRLHRWEIKPAGTEGFKKAEITLGGIDTNELSSKTMESKKVKGLYFVGEVIDVTGQLGGYNLQWAWSSGYAAGQYV